MNILEELYYGNLDENDRKILADKKALQKEFATYDKLKAQLTEEQFELLTKYTDLATERTNNEAKERYIAGFKHGIWVGLEVSILDSD